MIEYIISTQEAGRSLEKYLAKVLPDAPKSFWYKALRTNKIKVNGKKPEDMKTLLRTEDSLKLFITDEQLADFAKEKSPRDKADNKAVDFAPWILYEDSHILVFNKPAGVLSQKDTADEDSANEYALRYLKGSGYEASAGFTPGVLNRLDRATSGCLIMAKDLASAQELSKSLADGRTRRFYLALVKGNTNYHETHRTHFWVKNAKTNEVTLYPTDVSPAPKAPKVSTVFTTVHSTGSASLVKAELLTGKSHQIRAQLAFDGHPIFGDKKYGHGPQARGDMCLCAVELSFSGLSEPLSYLNDKAVTADTPDWAKF